VSVGYGAMRIALATCTDLPDWEVDDRPLHEALVARGVDLFHPTWDDADFDWSQMDACLIRTTWDYYLRLDEFVAWAKAAEKQTRLFNPSALVAWNTNKLYMRELAELGVPIIDTEWLDKGAKVDLGQCMKQRGWRRGLLKPVVGASAYGTCRFDDHGDSLVAAQQFLNRMLVDHAMQLQPYLEQVESHGEESMLFIDGAYAHSVRKIPVPGDYRVQDDHGATDEAFTHTAEEIELARSVMTLVEQNPVLVGNHSPSNSGQGHTPLLYGRIDWLRDEHGALRLCELEVVEPSLFLRHGPNTAVMLADALLKRIVNRD
jgi:glutathione synthase/RimK-type ligase-like ATP-grasp enzyme